MSLLTAVRARVYHWLRWSEHYSGTDMVYLAKGGFWLGLGQGIASVSSLALAIAFANLLPPEIYGAYKYVLAVGGVLLIATLPGIDTAVVKAVANGKEGILRDALRTKAAWSVLGVIAAFAYGTYHYAVRAEPAVALGIYLVGIFLPLIRLASLYKGLLHGRRNFRRATLYGSLGQIITTLVLLGTIAVTDSLLIVVCAYLIPETVSHWEFLRRTLRGKSLKGDTDPAAIRYGMHLSAMEVLKIIAGQFDKLIVFHFLGATELAFYSIAIAAPGQIKSLLQHITTLAFPKFSVATEAAISRFLPGKILKLELAIVPVVIAYVAAAPLLFAWVFPQYVGAVGLSQLYALTLLFQPRTFFSTALTAQAKQRELYGISITAPLARMAILSAALALYGLYGIIVGAIAANAANAAIYHYYFRRAFKKPFKISPADQT